MAQTLEYVGSIMGLTTKEGAFTCFRCVERLPKHAVAKKAEWHYQPPFDCTICEGRNGVVPLTGPAKVDDRHPEGHVPTLSTEPSYEGRHVA